MDRYNSEENGFDLNELPSNYTAAVSDSVSGHYTAPTASFSQSTQFRGASRPVSHFITEIPLERSSFPMQNLWNGATAPSLIEQHGELHGGSSRNQSNAFIQPSVTHMMMRDLAESSSNVAIHRSSGGRRANFLRNYTLVIGESSTAVRDRERIQSVGGSVRETGHRDNPIVIQDDEEDAQRNGRNMSYQAFLSLQERIGIGLRNNAISKLLKQRKYQSTDCSDSCSICLATYEDKEELGKIDCGHEFHSQCIRKWLKIKNSCPICRRIALKP